MARHMNKLQGWNRKADEATARTTYCTHGVVLLVFIIIGVASLGFEEQANELEPSRGDTNPLIVAVDVGGVVD